MKIRLQSNMQWFDLGIEYQFMFHLHHSHRLLKDSKPGFSMNDWESTDTFILRPWEVMKIFSEISDVETLHIEKPKKLKKQIIQRLDDMIPKMEYLTKT